ncbi:hypothetical protein WJX73_004641 [Symbiochloris irregularis]|uniref:G-patch domain-containing protein n=1 Tax=Symbiochloris irregularis TaxID=706552 RepID=A0AAW1PQ65_9CHLO
MAELRSEGLARTLGAENKGFKLLQQMGYRAGEGLGKDSSGRSDPLSLVLKPGRTGLGVDEAHKRKDLATEQQKADRALKRSRGEAVLKQSFQQQQAAQFAARRVDSHVRQAREACEAWEDLPAAEKLNKLLSHLRLRHHHCLFCGAQYKDAEELAALCPGEDEDAH